jgi:hypothetical protein
VESVESVEKTIRLLGGYSSTLCQHWVHSLLAPPALDTNPSRLLRLLVLTRGVWRQGDPSVLVFGLDYQGNLCGKKNDGGLNLEGFDYRYWPNSQEIANAGMYSNPAAPGKVTHESRHLGTETERMELTDTQRTSLASPLGLLSGGDIQGS